ncbi:MAG: glycosyltransferase family 9 protein [Candidatus Eisenbacteria bacterium]
MTPGAPARILAVRQGRAGDLVMLTPALRLLLDAFPGAELDLWTSAEGPRVLRGFDPRLARLWVDPRRFPAAWFARASRGRELRAAGYERIYVFETHPRYGSLLREAAPAIFAMARRDGLSPRHFSDRCLDLVEASLSAPLPRPWASLPVSDAGRAAADAYLAAHGLTGKEPLVGLHLTYSESARGLFAGRRGRKHRAWSMAEAARLARMLAEPGRGVRPVIDVLPEERALLAPFLERAGDAVTVLGGPQDFERYKALLARLALLVSPNTGPMHVAAAVGTPVVALFSGWDPAECGPFVPPARVRILRAEDTATPARGLAAIGADSVYAACLELLPA